MTLAQSYDPRDDVIKTIKSGCLNYRVKVTNSDTSGIEIKMIVCAGTVTDLDGNVYQTVKLGNQVWTVENLKTTKYNDGTVIPHITDSAEWANLTTAGYCYYGNDSASAANAIKYGALYNWHTVNTGKLAPTGWHVPDTSDWNTLQNYLIANGYNWGGTTTGNKIAKSMAAKTDWLTSRGTGVVGSNIQSNNSTGFSALPGGFRYTGGFVTIGRVGIFWSSTESGVSVARIRSLDYLCDDIRSDHFSKKFGFSVRLLRD